MPLLIISFKLLYIKRNIPSVSINQPWHSWVYFFSASLSHFLFSSSLLLYFFLYFLCAPLSSSSCSSSLTSLWFQTCHQYFTHPQNPSHETCHLICKAWAWDVGWSNLHPLWYDNSILCSSEIKSMRKRIGQLGGKMSFPHPCIRASSPTCPSSISRHLLPPEVWSSVSFRHSGIPLLKSLCHFSGLSSQDKGGSGDNQGLEPN